MLTLFKSHLSPAFATYGLVSMSLIGLIYHFLIITQVIDYKYAWGGRLHSVSEMYTFEAVSVIIQLLFITMVISYHKMAATHSLRHTIRALLAIMVLVFALNTLGNLNAKQDFEKYAFTPITFFSAILALRLVVESGQENLPKNRSST